jgi:hypothetical protein
MFLHHRPCHLGQTFTTARVGYIFINCDLVFRMRVTRTKAPSCGDAAGYYLINAFNSLHAETFQSSPEKSRNRTKLANLFFLCHHRPF